MEIVLVAVAVPVFIALLAAARLFPKQTGLAIVVVAIATAAAVAIEGADNAPPITAKE